LVEDTATSQSRWTTGVYVAGEESIFSCSSRGLWDTMTTNHNKAAVRQSHHQAQCLSAILVSSYIRSDCWHHFGQLFADLVIYTHLQNLQSMA